MTSNISLLMNNLLSLFSIVKNEIVTGQAAPGLFEYKEKIRSLQV
ncbi:hypothetical protein MNBD_GAMMA17-1831 [hydrothermal vent metagenome]|uniref:Uncharacterized protein n=1 Tax=hydrothermal vent metagenome TaxID=652676 RepID=A0A3B0ZNX7_9ZZZZ